MDELYFFLTYYISTLYDACLLFTLQMRCFDDNIERTLMVFQDECICHREAEKDEN